MRRPALDPGLRALPFFLPFLNFVSTLRPVIVSNVSCFAAPLAPRFGLLLPSNGQPTAMPPTMPEKDLLLLRMMSFDVSTASAPCRNVSSSIISARSSCVCSSTSCIIRIRCSAALYRVSLSSH